MSRKSIFALLAFFVFVSAAFAWNGAVAWADPASADAEDSKSDEAKKSDETKSDEKKADEKKKDDAKKPFKEVVPDATSIPGLIPMYRKKDNLYAEIGSAQRNIDYIIVISIAKGIGTGGLYTGQSWDFGDDMLWQFRKVDDRIQIVRRNYRYTADSGTTEEKAVKIGFSDSILYSLPIIAAGPSGGDIIDLTNIFLSDLPGISRYALPGYSFARDRSSWAKIKGKNDNLTDNMELEVAATYSSSGGGSSSLYTQNLLVDSRAVSVNVHYSISKLPTGGYTPRLADERVGYFTTAVKNFNKNPDDGNFVRYINRWNLQKLEPKADVSLPKKPIVFWLEKTIPYQYRKPIRDGILEWNKAFEEAGFYNAIEVRQQEDNDTWDPEDINYNTIRWSTASMGFAIGPSRVNPLTGEILDADVVLDVGFINGWNREFEIYSPSELAIQFVGRTPMTERLRRPEKFGSESDLPAADDFNSRSERIPFVNERLFQSQQMGLVSTFFEVMTANATSRADEEKDDSADEKKEEKKEESADEPKEEKSEDSADEKKEEKSDDSADEPKEEKSDDSADEKKDEKSEDKSDDEKEKEKEKKEKEEKEKAAAAYEAERTKMIRQGLSWITTHEVGHTLGLRHNFKLSSLHSLEEINDPEKLGKYGFSGSVMEYIPVNLMPAGEKQGDYYPTKLGQYDYWVIQYGYKTLGNSTDGDRDELKKIAAEQSKPEHNYAEDYDCYFNSDPLINVYDLGSDPLEYFKLRVRLFKQILPGLNDRIVKEGESYTKLRSRFSMLFSDYGIAMYDTTRYIGGIHINRDFKGDDNARAPFVVVSAAEQRAAMDFLASELFSIDPFRLTPDLTNYLAPNRWLHWGSNIPSRYDADLHSLLQVWQKYVLYELFSEEKLSRMADAELRLLSDQDVFTVGEMFEKLSDAIFAEIGALEGDYTAQKPAVSSVRRNLQREYFNQLAAMSLQKLYGWNSLFSSMIGDVTLRENNDVSSLARQQLREMKGKIDKALKSEIRLDPASKAHLTDLSVRAANTLDAAVKRDY